MSFGVIVSLSRLVDKILQLLPGGELRRCYSQSTSGTKCIKSLNHYGKCEDAWSLRWKRRIYKL